MAGKEIPDYGDVFTLDEFIYDVQNGSFIDYDGSGYYATVNEYVREMYPDLPARPSEIYRDNILREYSHVVWFNK